MRPQTGQRHALLTAAGGLAILLMAVLAYAPGLSGGFLFDDFVNLDAIGATGPVDNWPTFWRYLTSGTADPLGRPLALLSFLADARDWPAEPGPFLRTNLLLHLGNGVLLFWLLRRLGRAIDGPGPRLDAAALLGAGLWLLHPLLVSTTLYIVQREAMLPATFMLAGLIAYVHGRLLPTGGWRGPAWMIAGIVGGTALSMLCKANGLLLPLMAGALELSVLRHGAAAPAPAAGTRRLAWVLLGIPSLLVLAWLCLLLPQLFDVVPARGWSPAQRLLTEARVICEYLWLLLVPRSVSTGLYNDGYLASSSLLHPWTTLPCVLAVLALLAGAWRWRAHRPALSAALLFFFAGHVLESTLVPLELYFEHRNYVPAMLLFWPLARALCAAPWRPAARLALALALLALFAATTLQRASLWGRPQQLAALWALQNPASSRAQATIAIYDTAAGHPELAIARLGPIWRQRPVDLQAAFNFVNARCAQGEIGSEDLAALRVSLAQARLGHALISGWLQRALDGAVARECRGLDLDAVDALIAAAAANPIFSGGGQISIAHLRGQLEVARGHPARARAEFDQALRLRPTPAAAARQAALLAMHGYHREALGHLDLYESLRGRMAQPPVGMPRVHAWVLERQGYWETEMRVLREKLHAEIGAR
jgi:hypothetical protein